MTKVDGQGKGTCVFSKVTKLIYCSAKDFISIPLFACYFCPSPFCPFVVATPAVYGKAIIQYSANFMQFRCPAVLLIVFLNFPVCSVLPAQLICPYL